MTDDFFEESAQVREAIRRRIIGIAGQIPHPKMRDIINQRNKTSSFLKGTISYFIHEGVGGRLPEEDKIELATGIEVLCSSGAIFDNAIDGHEERNGETTFLKEYGVWMQVAASQYALHHGLRILLPFMQVYTQKFSHMYSVDDAVIGMIGMDIEQSGNLQEQVRINELSNGRFAEVPLVIAATTGTDDEIIIGNISKYGFNLGATLGIYEEIRDMLGKHGRRRATEIERGRFSIPLHLANESGDFNAGKYVGGNISDDEYIEMMNGVIKSNAMHKAKSLADEYFNQAAVALRMAVDGGCFEKLGGLRKSISSEFERMIIEAEAKYG